MVSSVLSIFRVLRQGQGCQGDLQISGSAKRRKPAYSADDRSAESVFGKERVTQIDAK